MSLSGSLGASVGQRVPEIPHKPAVPAEREAFLRTAASRRSLTTDITIPHVMIIDQFNQLTPAASLMVPEPFERLRLWISHASRSLRLLIGGQKKCVCLSLMSSSAVKPGPHLQTRIPTSTRLPLLSRDGVYVVFQKLALCAFHVSASHLELLITSHRLAAS